MATIAEPRSRSRPSTTTPNPPSRPHSSHSPSPVRTPRPRSENQNRRSVGSVSVFSGKNKLRKNHPLATTHGLSDDPTAIKSMIDLESSSSSASTPPARQSPVNVHETNHTTPSSAAFISATLTDEAARIVRRASPGYAIARPNSSLSLLKPTATSAQKVRGFRGASRAVRMKIIRAFGRLFSPKGKKDRGQNNIRIGAPKRQKEGLFVRLFVPKRFLQKKHSGELRQEKEKKKGEKKAKTGSRAEKTNSPDGRKDSKLALDGLSVIDEEGKGITTPTGSIILRQPNRSTDSPKKGILRLRLKQEDQLNEDANEHANGHANRNANGHVDYSHRKPNLPPGVMLVEDPVWTARRKSFNDPQTPPRTPTRDNSTDTPTPNGKSQGPHLAASSKSLITAYESGFVVQDRESTSGRKMEQGESWFKDRQNQQNQFQQHNTITPPELSITPPPPVRTPPDEIGLAITTDDISIISEISRKSSRNSRLTPNYLSDYESDEERPRSWRIPNNLVLDDPIRRSHNNPLDTENSVRRVRDSTGSNSTIVSTPTRIVTSPTSRSRRSPAFDGEEEMVEFNVLVRPGDALYDILVEQEQSQAYGGGEIAELEVESEIEYFTADENDTEDDDGDADSVASGAGTIRAVEIASEGGTMRGVEIVGKSSQGGRKKGEGSGGWGFSDVLVGSRR